MFEVQKLTKYYGDTAVVRNVSFSAEQGDIIGFLGLNGAGKTTTLRMLSTFLQPTSGDFRIGEMAASRTRQAIREVIGYLPEVPPLYPELRVSEYLTFAAEIKGVPSGDIRKRVEQVIEKCDLNSVTKKLCGNLSKGYRQRVGIAQAIVHQPKVLLLDEPTSGLDPEQLQRTRKLFRELSQSTTIILSTHIFGEVAEVCNRLVVIHNGSIQLEKPPGTFQPSEIESLFLSSIQESTHA